MEQYAYSYKSDSTNEVIGIIDAKNINDALLFLCEIKRLDVDSVNALFNIKKVENDTQNQN
jgi:hypothetical protein